MILLVSYIRSSSVKVDIDPKLFNISEALDDRKQTKGMSNLATPGLSKFADNVIFLFN